MTTTKEFFLGLLADEAPRFVRVTTALPADKLDYRPDPTSRTALELAQTIVTEMQNLHSLLTTGEVDFSKPSGMAKPETIEQLNSALITAFDQAAVDTKALDDGAWDSMATMKGAGEPWVTPRGAMALGFFLDLIHHRGQLSVYIRPMGGKVPSIYGPSADSKE